MASPCSRRFYRRRAAPDAILHAFDLLELNGRDFRPLRLGERKAKLARRA
jgi:ATP-dependent DNA ligase